MRRVSATSPLFLLLGALLFGALPAGAAARAQSTESAAADPTGEWMVAKRVAHIRIVDCGRRLWGVISWEARPGGVDSHNPDPAKRTRPMLGMPVLLGMQQTRANEWEGEIYNAQDGKKYDASITLIDRDTLKVQGCVLGILCGGENWTRISAPADAYPPTTGTTPRTQAVPRRQAAPPAGKRQPEPRGNMETENKTGLPAADEALCSMLAVPARPAH